MSSLSTASILSRPVPDAVVALLRSHDSNIGGLLSVDLLHVRLSSSPAATRSSDGDSALVELSDMSDITRVTPFSRWDVDAVLPGEVSQKLGARFGRYPPQTLNQSALNLIRHTNAMLCCTVAFFR